MGCIKIKNKYNMKDCKKHLKPKECPKKIQGLSSFVVGGKIFQSKQKIK